VADLQDTDRPTVLNELIMCMTNMKILWNVKVQCWACKCKCTCRSTVNQLHVNTNNWAKKLLHRIIRKATLLKNCQKPLFLTLVEYYWTRYAIKYLASGASDPQTMWRYKGYNIQMRTKFQHHAAHKDHGKKQRWGCITKVKPNFIRHFFIFVFSIGILIAVQLLW